MGEAIAESLFCIDDKLFVQEGRGKKFPCLAIIKHHPYLPSLACIFNATGRNPCEFPIHLYQGLWGQMLENIVSKNQNSPHSSLAPHH